MTGNVSTGFLYELRHASVIIIQYHKRSIILNITLYNEHFDI